MDPDVSNALPQADGARARGLRIQLRLLEKELQGIVVAWPDDREVSTVECGKLRHFQADPVHELQPVIDATGLVLAGRTDEARATLAGWTMSSLPHFHDLEFVAFAAIATAAAGTAPQQRGRYARLEPYAGAHIVVGGCASHTGPVDHHLGALAATLGHREGRLSVVRSWRATPEASG